MKSTITLLNSFLAFAANAQCWLTIRNGQTKKTDSELSIVAND